MVVRTRSNSPTKPQGTGGTFVCTHDSVAEQTERLTEMQLERFKTWLDSPRGQERAPTPIFRRLHPREELSSMGWRPGELPGFASRTDKQTFEWVADSLCPPVFEAYVARMMHVMGKALPDGIAINEASEEAIEARTNRHGVNFFRVRALSDPEEEESED